MKARTTLYAEEGMILTNGEHFGRIVHLAVGANASEWYEISVDEYNAIMEEREKEAGGEVI